MKKIILSSQADTACHQEGLPSHTVPHVSGVEGLSILISPRILYRGMNQRGCVEAVVKATQSSSIPIPSPNPNFLPPISLLILTPSLSSFSLSSCSHKSLGFQDGNTELHLATLAICSEATTPGSSIACRQHFRLLNYMRQYEVSRYRVSQVNTLYCEMLKGSLPPEACQQPQTPAPQAQCSSSVRC